MMLDSAADHDIEHIEQNKKSHSDDVWWLIRVHRHISVFVLFALLTDRFYLLQLGIVQHRQCSHRPDNPQNDKTAENIHA